jgi:hypothetical protein
MKKPTQSWWRDLNIQWIEILVAEIFGSGFSLEMNTLLFYVGIFVPMIIPRHGSSSLFQLLISSLEDVHDLRYTSNASLSCHSLASSDCSSQGREHIHSLNLKSVHVPEIVSIIYLLANNFDESRVLYRRAFCSVEMLINEVMCEFLSR